jgi:formylglycine-generating enzyme required for sulfatase activity
MFRGHRLISNMFAVALASCFGSGTNAVLAAITIETVPIGNPGNFNDPATNNLYGGVANSFQMGKYDVTIGQYTAFLNAVAATDTYGLYNPSMATDLHVAGISRNGAPGRYTYALIGSANRPITYVTWGDAARFVNWLQNGQPSGNGGGTTETGAYTLNGAISDVDLSTVTRNAGATWFIPTENEWYKAAYFDPNKSGGPGYWTFATGTNTAPTSAMPGSAPNMANYFGGNGYAVTGSDILLPNQNYLTDVGAYTASASPYGTFDQSGDVYQWSETLVGLYNRRNRGGSWDDLALSLSVQGYRSSDGASAGAELGFRVATVAASSLIGDYNGDGVVDAADYTVWRDHLGQSFVLQNRDSANTGPISMADYTSWETNFGNHAGSGSMGNAAVPEPGTAALAVVACGMIWGWRKRLAE